MTLQKIRHIVFKELKERRFRLLVSFILLSLVSALFFVPRFYGWDEKYTGIITEYIPYYRAMYPQLSYDILNLIVYTDIYFPVFILIPAIVSPFLGVLESVIVEKEGRTLEVMLALPISDQEILIGKMGGSMAMGIGFSWLIFLIHVVFLGYRYSDTILPHLISIEWIILVTIFSPVMSFIVNSLGVIVAIWLKKLTTAANLGILILSPFFLFVFFISFGRIILDLKSLIFMSFSGSVTGILLFLAARYIFEREKLILRY